MTNSNENLRKTSSGEWLIEKMMEGCAYAGTNSKQELMELEKNLRQLLQLKIYPYTYIENYLMSQGYAQKDIRNIFKEIAGLSVSDFLGPDYEIKNIPDEIPTFNLGWGECKSGKHDYMFIMPWLLGYAIFGQKGDIERDQLEMFDILEDARASLTKQVKEYRQYNKVPHLDLEKQTEDWASSFSEPKFSSLSEQGKSLVDYLTLVNGSLKNKSSLTYIKESYFNGTITKNDLQILVKAADTATDAGSTPVTSAPGDVEVPEGAEDETVSEEEQEMMNSSLEEDLKELSPAEFFENSVQTESNLAPIMAKVDEYFDKKKSELEPDFKFSTETYKYKRTPEVSSGEPNVDTAVSQPVESLKSSAVLAVVIAIQNTMLPEAIGTKPGMLVFTMLDGNLKTSGILKGLSNSRISFSVDGLHKYFEDEEKTSAKESLF